MVLCSIVVTFEKQVDNNSGLFYTKSYLCKRKGLPKIWSNRIEAQQYVDRLRFKLSHRKNSKFSILIIPGAA